MSAEVILRKKLIEVAIPLDAINLASAREKSIRQGHPSTLHLWWARRPLAAARAVIFAQMVDDPSNWPDLFPTAKAQEKERQRLFQIIEDLVQWENTTNESVLERAREEIWRSWRRACAENADHPLASTLFDRNVLPAFHDPFAGGGSIPLEAQRLGLRSFASDLNPVAVLINKAMIEIPPMFAGRPAVNLTARDGDAFIAREWSGAQGLADDVRFYGQWMRDEAEKRLQGMYPKIRITKSMVAERPDLRAYLDRDLTVIAWLWARTVKSPNPAFRDVEVPLASSFVLSKKEGKNAYVDPVIDGATYRFRVKSGSAQEAQAAASGTKLSRGANFRCLLSGTPIGPEYIRGEGMAGKIGNRLMAIVAQGDRERLYLSPTPDQEASAATKNGWEPDGEMITDARAFTPSLYGYAEWKTLFTPRQLRALSTYSDLVAEVKERIFADAKQAGLPSDGQPLRAGGAGAPAYADAVAVYLSIAVSRLADISNTLCGWEISKTQVRHLFTRQAIPMLWDFAENNVFGEAAGDFRVSLASMAKALEQLPATVEGAAVQAAAQTQMISVGKVVSTDPPYYDNVPYADLSDFFYVWLRRSARVVYPDLFSTVAVPKDEELVAFAYRHDGKKGAETFFLEGMTEVMHKLAEHAHPAFPVTIYYAFKQAENDGAGGTASTGWETFFDAVIRAGFAIGGTWPMRTELSNRMRGMDSNALASSIVLVCRHRRAEAPTATRREFVAALKAELPDALSHLQRGNIAPVDLAQAAIGPGMAVYTRYSRVVDAEGNEIPVRAALALINQVLDEALAEQEGDFDSDTQWALAWFEQNGFDAGDYGIAETLSKAKNTSVRGMKDGGILDPKSPGGKVRLLRPSELPTNWNPLTDSRLSGWEIVHHLVRVLEAHGEGAAAQIVGALGSNAEPARELAYRLYTVCERKKRAAEALTYNALVQSWPEINRLAQGEIVPSSAQTALFGEG